MWCEMSFTTVIRAQFEHSQLHSEITGNVAWPNPPAVHKPLLLPVFKLQQTVH
jgi:hypothetical protein